MLQQKLSDCEHAHFSPGKDRSCLEGTRIDLLERIKDWTAEDSGETPCVFWLRGKAGAGKTGDGVSWSSWGTGMILVAVAGGLGWR